MFNRKRKERKKENAQKEPEIISCSLEDMRKAVNRFADNADQRLSLRSIINQDNTIDAEFLAPYLGGIPDRTFYMSKETYDIFEEEGKAHHIDRAQIACDQYFLETGQFPFISGDKTGKISYFKLKNYLIEEPPFDLYLDPKDRMVTHRKPPEEQ